MCLLIKQNAGHTFSAEWLKDFYIYNSDGLGIMWAEDGVLTSVKTLPKNEKEVIDFYNKNGAGKECAIHFRMRTHGDTDLSNCHPYEIYGDGSELPLYLMHNGVLHTGNKKDLTKSDTWHFINDIIKPALDGRPHEYKSEWFKALVEGYIGSGNKFIILDVEGHMEIFNKSSGLEWEGQWMSNTYAWSAPRPKSKSYHTTNNAWSNWSTNKGYTDYDDYQGYSGHSMYGYDKLPSNYNDQEEFCELMYDELLAHHFDFAATAITIVELQHYYGRHPSTAWKLLNDIEDGNYTENQILEIFDKEAEVMAMEESFDTTTGEYLATEDEDAEGEVDVYTPYGYDHFVKSSMA